MKSLPIVVTWVVSASVAAAQPIPIINPSFEAEVTPRNYIRLLVPSGWSLYDPAGIVDQNLDAVGVLNCMGGQCFPSGAPHGSNAALIFLSQDIELGEVGFQQTTGAVLAPFTAYTLTVEVGNIASCALEPPLNQLFNLEGFPGYSLQILAGGEVIAEDRNSLQGAIPEGEFRTGVVQLSVGAGHPRLGQPLGVRLLNLNLRFSPQNPGVEVDFDVVTLAAAALCPGDFNADGGIDGADVQAFFESWEAGSADADMNGDGGTDGADVEFFFQRWEAGC